MWSLNHCDVSHWQVEVLPLQPKTKVLSIMHVQALNRLIKCSAEVGSVKQRLPKLDHLIC